MLLGAKAAIQNKHGIIFHYHWECHSALSISRTGGCGCCDGPVRYNSRERIVSRRMRVVHSWVEILRLEAALPPLSGNAQLENLAVMWVHPVRYWDCSAETEFSPPFVRGDSDLSGFSGFAQKRTALSGLGEWWLGAETWPFYTG